MTATAYKQWEIKAQHHEEIWELCNGLADVAHNITDLLAADHPRATELSKLVPEQIGINIMYFAR